MKRDTCPDLNVSPIDVVVRRAVAADQAQIVALVRSEPLNPNGLHWHRFVVACDDQGLVGAAQLRSNSDGSHELASLVVAPRARGRGVATRMIELLAGGRVGRVFAVTRRANVPRFARWGFVPIAARDAARDVRQRRWLGQFGGGLVSLLRGRWPAALVVLERVADYTNRKLILPSGP
jgi:amino-acid N-acetyltransferase